MTNVSQLFERIAKSLPGYEQRPGQLQLARAVELAIANQTHALAEGPCGTGKSLAYLIPAIASGKTVVVATANIALQEQLVNKDLPFLQERLGIDFKFALLKGRSNYLCPKQLLHVDRDVKEFTTIDREQLTAIVRWGERTTTGDISELPFVPSQAVRFRTTVSSEDCLRNACVYWRGLKQPSPDGDPCFANRAYRKALAANIIVTNFHMLFAHLQLVELGMPGILPMHDVLIMDEAHEAPDVARAFFGFSILQLGINLILSFTKRNLRHALPFCNDVNASWNAFFTAIAPLAGKRIQSMSQWPATNVHTLVDDLAALLEDYNEAQADKQESERQAKAARILAQRLTETIQLADKDKTYFVERNATNNLLMTTARYVDVSSKFRSLLFDRVPTVVLTSATLSTGGPQGFDFIRREVGVPSNAMQLEVASPFDFYNQSLLVIPEGMPDPRSDDFAAFTGRTVQLVADACKGRTLALFTSYRALNATASMLQGHRVLKQGDSPRTQLVDTFREDVASVLLGTASLWTGVDVSGESLTGLVIDKIPFDSPDDPVLSALQDKLGSKMFPLVSLPRAIIRLKQGVGRLIRAKTDHGVIVLLDQRVADKAYGRTILQALPRMRFARSLNAITDWLR